MNLGAQVSGYVSNMEPSAKYTASDKKDTSVDDVFTYASATTPGMVFRAPDGRYGAMNNSEDDAQSANNNPLIRLNSKAGNIRKTNMRSRFVGTLKPSKAFLLQHHILMSSWMNNEAGNLFSSTVGTSVIT